MKKRNPQKENVGFSQRYKRLSTSKKVILIVFIIWLIQAIPKWTAAIISDGETSARIMRFFLTPREDRVIDDRPQLNKMGKAIKL